MTTKSTKTNHYTYIIRHINGRYYVGRRSTKKDPLLDSYMGSGKWVKSIKDRSTLTKNIIAYYPSIEELKIAEFELIEKYFLDEYCMNVAYSSCGAASGDKHPMYGQTHTKEARKKISDANSGDKNPQYGRTGELCPSYGMIHTKEARKKISDSKSGDKNPQYGRNGVLSPTYGMIHTDKSKKLMSDALSGEKAHNASITDYIAKMIKIRISEGVKNKPIAEEYNTTLGVVANIRSGKNWKHIII